MVSANSHLSTEQGKKPSATRKTKRAQHGNSEQGKKSSATRKAKRAQHGNSEEEKAPLWLHNPTLAALSYFFTHSSIYNSFKISIFKAKNRWSCLSVQIQNCMEKSFSSRIRKDFNLIYVRVIRIVHCDLCSSKQFDRCCLTCLHVNKYSDCEDTQLRQNILDNDEDEEPQENYNKTQQGRNQHCNEWTHGRTRKMSRVLLWSKVGTTFNGYAYSFQRTPDEILVSKKMDWS